MNNYPPLSQVHIVNLRRRIDRRLSISEHFRSFPEFEIHFFEAIEDSVPAFGLYRSLYSIIENAQKQRLDYVVICEDDHQFTDAYDKDLFQNYMAKAKDYNADVFLGGVSWFDNAIRVEKNLYWIERFTGAQFMVIFSSFYQRILQASFSKNEVIDLWICGLSDSIFVTVPMLSIQKDFGYSDVTPKNNQTGRVDELFSSTVARWESLEMITTYINEKLPSYIELPCINDVQLPTYVINLFHRKDRLAHILEQFSFKNEFEVHIVEAIADKNGALGLWKSILKVVQLAKDREDEVILICEDDHQFCDGYSSEKLLEAIYHGAYLGADLILGGISRTKQIIPASERLCWINRFQCTQFIIIFNHFFDTILEADFNDFDTADLKLSNLTVNKYVIHPFISVQKDFGYSDIPIDTLNTDKYLEMFQSCNEKIDRIRKQSERFKNKNIL